MNNTINTVTGTITPDELGLTLMHEHVFVQYSGALSGKPAQQDRYSEAVSVCTRHIESIRGVGVQTIVDPTTIDLGRNVPLMAEISSNTGLNIICSAGIYSTAAYLNIKRLMGKRADAAADMFIKDITEGVGDTGAKAGIIKVVTGYPDIGKDEHDLLLSAAKASVETNTPVITHTEGILGDEQQNILKTAGVPAHRIIIGHSCSSTDFDYHMRIIEGGSYLGFDRFGMENIMPDEVRAASILKLIEAGCASRLIVSHDSVWYWAGGPDTGSGAYKNWKPTNFFERIIPMLKHGGATDEHISTMLCENPRRFLPVKQPELNKQACTSG